MAEKKKVLLVGNWSEKLADDLVTEILKKVLLGSITDFLNLRATTTSLRSSADQIAPFTEPWPPTTTPCLLLPQKEKDREFYSMAHKGVTIKVPIPEAVGRRVLECRFGWLVVYKPSGEVTLINPLLRSSATHLPSFLPLYGRNLFPVAVPFPYLRRAVLSANPRSSSDFVLVVLTSDNIAGFWRTGDLDWSFIRFPDGQQYDRGMDVAYQDGVFYLLGGYGVYSFNPVTMAVNFIDVRLPALAKGWASYLVPASPEQLLLVYRNGATPIRVGRFKRVYGTTEFAVYRINLAAGASCQKIQNLDEGVSLFVGHNASFAVSASDKPNCIFFTDDSQEAYLSPYHTCTRCGSDTLCNATRCPAPLPCKRRLSAAFRDVPAYEYSRLFDADEGAGRNSGIYHLGDGRIHRLPEEAQRCCSLSPPTWVVLSSSFSH